TGTSDDPVARGSYAYFGRGPGTLAVHIGRAGFCQPSAPGTQLFVRIGSVALSGQRQPYVKHARQVRRFHLANCKVRHLRLEEQGPVAVEVRAAPTIRP